MPERGDDVDWAGLFHAEGPASDTPRRLRALLGGDARAFVDGYAHLWSGTLRRDGGVWPVTVSAALLVAEWLDDSSLWPDDPTMPEAVLAYLYAVGCGADLGNREAEVRACVTRRGPELRRWTAEYLSADAAGRERLWGDDSGMGELALQQAALACGRAVPELLGRVLPHLGADRARRRTCAAAAVGALARHPSVSAQRPVLIGRLVSPAGAADSPYDLATRVIAVGQLGGDTRSWLSHPHLGVRVCAALAPALAHDAAAAEVLRVSAGSPHAVGEAFESPSATWRHRCSSSSRRTGTCSRTGEGEVSGGSRRQHELMDDATGSGGIVVRRALESESDALVGVDAVAGGGDVGRRAAIRKWCGQGSVLVAEDAGGLLGYCVLEYTFFDQGFVTMLMVAPSARGRGVGRRLLDAAAVSCTTPKLFTSTNVSNQPMQRLLHRAAWTPVGLLHGLDEGDPELFYLCRPPRTRTRTRTVGAEKV